MVVNLDIEKDYAVNRIGTNCTKWDGLSVKFGADNLLAMWIADMDFRAPDCVHEALQKVIDLGIYGYSFEDEGYYQSFIDWEKRKHGYTIKREWIRFTAGVVSGLYWFVNAMTQPGDACIILTPCYYPFMDAIRDTGRRLVCCELINTNGYYTIDLMKFENDIRENDIKLFILCSPHNPVGRVWTKEELKAILDTCKKYGVFVISDEIHQDLTLRDYKNTPAATVGDYDNMLVTLTSASKTFNLAGCKSSFALIPDKTIRDRFDRYIKSIRVARGSMFGYAAVEAAYKQGEPWLEEILKVIEGNFQYLRDALTKELPKIVVTPLEGTFLMWIDLGAYVSYEHLQDFVQNKCKLALDYGEWFFEKGIDTHIRINLATPRKNIETAAQSLIKEIKNAAKKLKQ
jgi:cysteine-S-conjugate beta-lyase